MKVAFITTCMGRLNHAKQSATRLLSDPRIDGKRNYYVFVDYTCPQNSGEYIQNTFPQSHVLWEVIYGEQNVFFHKSVALNRGAIRAAELGADYLVFIDADTLVTTKLLDFIFAHARLDQFMVMLPHRQQRDLCGFLGVHKTPFWSVGGFDSQMLGWGAEDLDMRLKLLLQMKLQWTEVPPSFAYTISHSDTLRTQYSPFQHKQESNRHNLRILDNNVRRITGLTCRQLFNTPIGPQVRMMLGLPQTPAEPNTLNDPLGEILETLQIGAPLYLGPKKS